MRYSKPELLAAEAALTAIRGFKADIVGYDSENQLDPRTDSPAYEVDE